KGLIYKGLKPIYWSPSSESAFAEAEIEYMEKTSPSIFVGFDVVDQNYPNTRLIIWTTTPWTLPGNLAVSVHPDFEYVLFETGHQKYIVVKDLLEQLKATLKFDE